MCLALFLNSILVLGVMGNSSTKKGDPEHGKESI